mgnify:CR=1 FL=1
MPFRHWRLSGHSINQIGNAEEVTWVRPTDNGIAHGDHCRDYDVLDNELHSGCQSLYPGNDRDGQRRCFYCNRFGFGLATLLLAFMAKLPFAQLPVLALNAFFRFYVGAGHGLFLADRYDSDVCGGGDLYPDYVSERPGGDLE